MTLDDIPVFAMLKSRLSYLTDRQQMIAQNVANSDTPGYTPKDLKPFTIPSRSGAGSLTLAPVATTLTSSMHLAPPATGQASGAKPIDSPDSETTLNGNSVVLEEEMTKLSQARTDYDAAISFYEQSLALIQTAVQRPT